MSYADETRLLLEARQLLAKQRNRDAVIQYYINRGIDADAAHEMINSIYHTNLRENRKSALGWLIGGGIGTALGLLIVLGAGRIKVFTVIVLVSSFISLLIGVARLIVANGYEMDEDD